MKKLLKIVIALFVLNLIGFNVSWAFVLLLPIVFFMGVFYLLRMVFRVVTFPFRAPISFGNSRYSYDEYGNEYYVDEYGTSYLVEDSENPYYRKIDYGSNEVDPYYY